MHAVQHISPRRVGQPLEDLIHLIGHRPAGIYLHNQSGPPSLRSDSSNRGRQAAVQRFLRLFPIPEPAAADSPAYHALREERASGQRPREPRPSERARVAHLDHEAARALQHERDREVARAGSVACAWETPMGNVASVAACA
jgi:hypothetical protein